MRLDTHLITERLNPQWLMQNVDVDYAEKIRDVFISA